MKGAAQFLQECVKCSPGKFTNVQRKLSECVRSCIPEDRYRDIIQPTNLYLILLVFINVILIYWASCRTCRVRVQAVVV